MRPLRFRWAERALEAVLEQIPHLEKEMLTLETLVAPGDVCFDVGAAGGIYMYLLARRTGPGGQVHAFEPRPRPYRAIGRARRLLGMDTVSVHRVGLADEKGSMEIRIPSWHGVQFTTRAFLASAHGRDAEQVPDGFTGLHSLTIPMTTIDHFVVDRTVRRIDFIKADVEGAELALLEGARTSIERWHPTILLEIEERHLGRYGKHPVEVVEFLTRYGYRMHVFADGVLSPVGEVTPSENNYLFF
ncbi:MAG TPA: FkbM family methyltransferase [Actinobacteria bacterium]|nr:31-O-demethyl-FK506 methyltransferase FkbM [bacterium BMS3Bbin01]HDH27246.1 FkbM family methyltransferase [Actinomycetota bacterium]HDL49570.1 FkbM family methyltransferase [Actinomycetota bacterium]